MVIEGTLKIKFTVKDGALALSDLSELNKRLEGIIEQSASEIEEVCDYLGCKIISNESPITIDQKLCIA